jgi:Ohr subfamily peroxiredoxin
MSTDTYTTLYTAHTHVTGGRGGKGRSSDGALDVALAPPGSNKPGTNPEQLFGVGYSSCFLEAIHLNAAAQKIRLPEGSSVDSEVSLLKNEAGQYQLAVVLKVDLPGMDEALKRELVEAAHQTCPYSRMTRGNVDVELAIV